MRNRHFTSSKLRKSRQPQPITPSDSLLAGDGTKPSILWSAILRNDTVLVEADLGASVLYEVQEAAQLLLKKAPTPGWEHATLNKRKVNAAATGGGTECYPNDDGTTSSVAENKLKGMKFHVYEHFAEEEAGDTDMPYRKTQRRYLNEGLTIWTFACVYDLALVGFVQVQSFLEKIVTVTEVFREPTVAVDDNQKSDQQQRWFTDEDRNPFSNEAVEQKSPQDVWRYGSHHAVQSTFAPVLLQRMEEVSYYGKLAMCNERVDAVKEIMSRNIDLILENQELQAQMANEKAAQLNEMAKVFAKSSKKVKRQMLWNNAKHGVIMGTAVTAGVAVVVVPPLVALL